MKVDQSFVDAVNNHISSLEGVTVGGGDPKKNIPPDDPTKIKLEDKRKMLAATNVPINKEKDLKSGTYDKQRIKNIIKAAKHVGIDPNTAISVALQESHIGNLNDQNIGNVYAGYGKAPAGLDQQSYELAAFLKEKITEGKKLGYKDEAHQLQMYNGMGKLKSTYSVNGKIQPQKFYGIEVSEGHPLDLKKNPLYGKTIIDLRDNLIKTNEEIQKLIHSSE